MNPLKIIVPAGCVALLVVGWYLHRWLGVATVASGLVMWLLLHFNRMLAVLRKAQDSPVGYVGSAVMLNAKAKPGVSLMHVMAMTQALGERRSAEGAEPEVYRWTDGGGSYVDCTFEKGKLVAWQLTRPETEPEAGAAPAP